MNTADSYRKMIDQALASIAYPAQPEGLYTPISYLLSTGGKRMRPVLLMLVSDMYGGDTATALQAAIALETYHNYTLMHDDLMDHADMRRGHETVHRKWDANTAILSGDTMLVKAYDLLLQCPSPRLDALVRLFTETALGIGEGQQYDMNFESRNDVSEDEYIEMIRLKTGVLIGCAMKMGAIIGGADEQEAGKVYSTGETLGLAFQLQDDYLDVYGNEAVFGKKTGGDIVNNKKTFLLIRALSKAKGKTHDELLRLTSGTAMDEKEKIAAVTAIYDSLHIGEDTSAVINNYFDGCRAILSSLSISAEARRPLGEYIYSLLGRKY